MREAHPLERAVGMAYYASDANGVGGRLRAEPAAFRVREVGDVDPAPLSADTGDYPHLVLRVTLRNWDTNDFANRLAGALAVSRERIGWAGTKDKRAVTTQLFSVRLPDRGPDALPDVAGAEIAPVGRLGRALQFGDLAGNEFEVVVAHPTAPGQTDAVTAELVDLAGERGDPDRPRVGVPNYFGQQRFGSRRPVTHEVGRRILRGDWAGAVLAYVGNPHEAEREVTREARRYVDETRDWAGAVERFPDGLRFERTLCDALAGVDGDPSPGDYRDALARLPRNLRRLFVHAVQSAVFNRVVSERLARGLPLSSPVAGDVICFTEERAGMRVPDPDRAQRVSEDRVETARRHCERGRAYVTAPLVGTDTDLGGGEPGAIEQSVLDDAGVSRGDFDRPDPYDAAGTRRAVLCVTEQTVTRDPLTFSFSLPRGSYATVVLREYLKAAPTDY
ncbi:MAG: tRNA pseudouridine(13) synthase TruD [Halobacteriaceae archaeon]